jgi:hypothetical protein
MEMSHCQEGTPLLLTLRKVINPVPMWTALISNMDLEVTAMIVLPSATVQLAVIPLWKLRLGIGGSHAFGVLSGFSLAARVCG